MLRVEYLVQTEKISVVWRRLWNNNRPKENLKLEKKKEENYFTYF